MRPPVAIRNGVAAGVRLLLLRKLRRRDLEVAHLLRRDEQLLERGRPRLRQASRDRRCTAGG